MALDRWKVRKRSKHVFNDVHITSANTTVDGVARTVQSLLGIERVSYALRHKALLTIGFIRRVVDSFTVHISQRYFFDEILIHSVHSTIHFLSKRTHIWHTKRINDLSNAFIWFQSFHQFVRNNKNRILPVGDLMTRRALCANVWKVFCLFTDVYGQLLISLLISSSFSVFIAFFFLLLLIDSFRDDL